MKGGGIYFAILCFIILFSSCENTNEEIDRLSKKKAMVDEAQQIIGYMSQGGSVKAKLTSPVMIRYQGDTIYTEFPKTLHVDFYDDQKRVDTKLDSKYGKYFESLDKIYLRDSVRIVSVQGDTLFCHDLWWDQNKEIFFTHKKAIRKSLGGQYYVGENGLEASQDLKRIDFYNNHGIVIVPKDDMPGGSSSSTTADSSHVVEK